jgi:hypothetical protein
MYALSDYEDFDVGTLDSSGNLVSLPKNMLTHLGYTSGAFYNGMELVRFTLREPVPDLRVKYESPFYIAHSVNAISP